MTKSKTQDNKNSNPPIYMVTGSKGGVGKSFFSLLLVYLLRLQGKELLVVETDTSNADICNALGGTDPADNKNGVTMITLNLDTVDGWMDLVNHMAAHPNLTVVIDCPARSNAGARSFGPLLRRSLTPLNRKLIPLWILPPERGPVQLLAEHLETFPTSFAPTHVVLNGKKTNRSEFSIYDNSKVREEIEAAGGKSLYLTELADRVALTVRSEMYSLEQAMDKLPLGNQIALEDWLEISKEAFAPIVGRAA